MPKIHSRLLATTLLAGASLQAGPALAQSAAPMTGTSAPADTGAMPNAAETTVPQEAQAVVPSTNAQGGPVASSQDIVITGTRIPQPNLTSASPVTVLSAQEIKLQGTTRTEDLINSLPQAFAGQGSSVSNGATGTASVNLRGLGPTRTLVLVNGRRLMPGDPAFPVADINFIPASMIKRVDVLTGGASSVYGADAVAGVVNFIMDTGFRGLRIDGQGSFSMHDNRAGANILNPNHDLGYLPPRGLSTNGGAQDIAGAFGAAFDDNRGSIMAYATYRHQNAILQASRDYSFCSLGANPAYTSQGSDFYCGGSSTSAEGRFRVYDPATGNRIGLGHVSGNQIVPGAPLFNFAPYNFFQRPDERYTFGTFANYEISPGAKPYLEAMFMNDQSDAQIAPSGNFNNTTYLNCDNPLLSAQEQAFICRPGFTFTNPGIINPTSGLPSQLASVLISRRNVEGGGRDANLEHTAFRIVAGMKGDLLKGLSYDAYYQFGTTRFAQTFFNDFSVVRLQRAIDVVTDPATGQPVCRSALNGTDPNCVPWNIFQTGGVTPEALNYLQTPGFQRGHVNETIADANLTFEGGEYGLQTPWADRGIGLNLGAEYRKEALELRVDEEFRTGDLAGSGGPTLPNSGSFDVREFFTELQVPIISHSFIDEFTLSGGYRYSDYKVDGGNSFSTNTYKLSAELAPVRDVRLRASYNRAVRAPNIVELFIPSSLGLAGGADFCAGATPVFTQAQCANTGVLASQYGSVDANPANQYNALFGGNTNLTPEKADTYTIGAVIQPRWIPGLAFTIDYFDIKVKNLIAALPFNGVLAGCAVTGDPTLCSLIHRDVTGSLFNLNSGYIRLQTVNVGGLQTKGVDFNASYNHKFAGVGTLNASFVGTWTRHLIFDTGINPGAHGLDGVYDCAGYFGATCTSGAPFSSPNPKWRHKLRLGFTLPDGLGISGQWRYFAKVQNDTLSGDPDLNFTQGPHSFPGDAKIPAQSYFDLTLSARLTDRYNFRIGANNIFDKSPPLVGGDVAGPPTGNGNTFPQTYDAMGRFVFAGFTVDF